MSTEDRLNRLEKSLRQWRRATVALICLFAVVLIAGATGGTPTELTVRRLTVVDEHGSPCITLIRKSATDFTGIVMEQPNAGGESKGGSIAIATSKDGASLRIGFGSQDGNKRAASLIVNRDDDGKLTITDSGGIIVNRYPGDL